MTPQSTSGLSTPGIPSALRREETNRPRRAHPNLSAQSAGTPALGFPVRPLRPSKLDPIRPPPLHPPQSAPSAPVPSAPSAPSSPSAPVRLVRPSPPLRPIRLSPVRPVRPVRPSLPYPGFCSLSRPRARPIHQSARP